MSVKGTLIAVAAAGLLSMGVPSTSNAGDQAPAPTPSKDKGACKGKGGCKAKGNCAGKGGCGGKGGCPAKDGAKKDDAKKPAPTGDKK